MHNSSRINQKISGEKVMALLFSDWEEFHDDDAPDEVEHDWEHDYNEVSEVELETVTNSLCEGKMNFTLHSGQMCAGGEEGREYCQEKLKTNQKVLKMLRSSDKVRAKQSLSLWANTP